MIKNKKILKVFLIFLILILIGAGIYFFIQNRTKKNWLVYENKIYGFSLKIPSVWTNKYSAEEKEDRTSFYYVKDIYRPSVQPKIFFQILVFTPEKWKEISSEPGYHGNLIYQDKSIVFAYTIPLENPYAADSLHQAEAEEFQKMVGQVKKIIKSFKFSKEKIPCAQEGTRINRNPLVGPTLRYCCQGLIEVRESKSYSVCKKTKKVLLYYYNPEKDKDETGNIKCSRDGLMPIEREIPASPTPIKDTIELLLKGKENLTEKELAEGITTEYPLEGLKLKSVNLKEDGTLILEFEDSLNKTVGGACRVGILWFQIEATAKQFPEVKKVQFLPEELFQP